MPKYYVEFVVSTVVDTDHNTTKDAIIKTAFEKFDFEEMEVSEFYEIPE